MTYPKIELVILPLMPKGVEHVKVMHDDRIGKA